MVIPQQIQIIKTSQKGNGILANQNFFVGDPIFSFIGNLLPGYAASIDALQIDENFFLESSMIFDNNLNHSCDPNCRIDFSERERPLLRAIRDIRLGDELSVNYNTTEYDMVSERCSFSCFCNSQNCLREIRGYKYLSQQQKVTLSSFFSPYIKTHFEKEFAEKIKSRQEMHSWLFAS